MTKQALEDSFFTRLSKSGTALTQSERKLVDYLLSHHPNGILDSASSIARHLKVSPSTVVRLFPKLGYESFAAAQRHVRLEISAKLSSPSQRASASIALDKSPSKQLIDDVLQADIDNLNATRSNLDTKAADQIVKLLVHRSGSQRKVYLLGEKNSFAAAQFLRTQLNMCLPNIELLDSRQSMTADNLLWIEKADLLLVISMRRYSTNSQRVAEHFKSLGCTVIAILDSPACPLAKLADHKLYAKTASPSAFDSYTSVFYLCNTLLAMVARAKASELRHNLKRGEVLWRHFQTFQEHGQL